MKVGLSYSRCILDIVEGRVDIEDVLIIISRTDFDPSDDEHWASIWSGYTVGGMSNPEWRRYQGDRDAEEKFRAVSLQLWHDGKFHQPRKFGAHPPRRREFWLETFLPSNELERNPAAKDAWERYQVIAGLVGVKMDTGYQ